MAMCLERQKRKSVAREAVVECNECSIAEYTTELKVDDGDAFVRVRTECSDT
jgi:hypothetical protein